MFLNNSRLRYTSVSGRKYLGCRITPLLEIRCRLSFNIDTVFDTSLFTPPILSGMILYTGLIYLLLKKIYSFTIDWTLRMSIIILLFYFSFSKVRFLSVECFNTMFIYSDFLVTRFLYVTTFNQSTIMVILFLHVNLKMTVTFPHLSWW